MKSTPPPPTPEELLRLARKAWPDKNPSIEVHDDGVVYLHDMDDRGRLVEALLVMEGRGRPLEATHAALLVLSGELDVAELLAERNRLRDYIDRVRDAEFSCGGDIAPVSQVLQEDP